MKLLYSNILPLGTEDNQETISDRFLKEISSSDVVEIAVGYVSKAALQELEQMVDTQKIRRIVLTIGMYFVEGMPESIYHTAIALNHKWVDAGIGEIRIVRAFKYHGKLYAFYKDDQVKSAIIGSANLGVIKLEANNRRQYEVSAVTEDTSECNEIATLIRKMAAPAMSARIDDVVGMLSSFKGRITFVFCTIGTIITMPLKETGLSLVFMKIISCRLNMSVIQMTIEFPNCTSMVKTAGQRTLILYPA